MIFLYHKIARLQHDYNLIGVTPKNFKYQIEYVRKYYDIVPLEQVREDTLAITFDDGFRDFYTEVYPYLLENNIPATLFITTDKIGSKEELWTTELLRLIFLNNDSSSLCHLEMPLFSYDFPTQRLEDKISMYRAIRRLCMKSDKSVLQSIILQLREWAGVDALGRKEYCFLTEREIWELSQNPLITIGAHTCSHRSLGALSKADQKDEIVRSKLELERIIGKEIQFFSYPFGKKYDYNEETIDVLKNLGIRCAYTTLLYHGKDMAYEYSRVEMPNLGGCEFDAWFQALILGHQEQSICRQGQKETIEYIGRLKEDKKLIQKSRKIAVFGAGIRGKKIYQELKLYGKEKEVVCFIDNDKEKQGKYLEKKLVISVDQIQELSPEIILVNSIWEKEIIEQLIHAGIRCIHWIVD